MFELLLNYVYQRMTIPDWMHNMARLVTQSSLTCTPAPYGIAIAIHRFVVWMRNTLVGPNGDGYASLNYGNDDVARERAETYGIFPEIWKNAATYLHRDLEKMLRGIYIQLARYLHFNILLYLLLARRVRPGSR